MPAEAGSVTAPKLFAPQVLEPGSLPHYTGSTEKYQLDVSSPKGFIWEKERVATQLVQT